MSTSDPQRTPLYELHLQYGGRLTDFAGSLLPTFYDGRGAIEEHVHTRTACSWFDVSHMLVCDVDASAEVGFERLTPTTFHNLAVGQSRYCTLTNENGGVIDDTIVTRTEHGLRLVLNAGCAVGDVAHLVGHLGEAVHPRFDLGLVALQGPASAAAIHAICPAALDLCFMESLAATWNGHDLHISRSGYTGEDGFEIAAPREVLLPLSEVLLSQPGVAPAGLAARDSLRLEAGLCLYGSDLSPEISPIEAGLTWTIPKARRAGGDYLGAAVIAEQLRHGPPRRLIGIAPGGRRPIRAGAALKSTSGDVVGVVTSGGWSPTLSRPIAIGYASGDHLPGTALVADVRGTSEPCEIVPFPFVSHNYVRRSSSAGKVG